MILTNTTNDNIIIAKKVIQNNQEFLVGNFKISQIRKFTKYTERLIVGYEEALEEEQLLEGETQIIPIYNPQIQRKANGSKVDKIADFLIKDPFAIFPTNIVVSVPNQVIDSLEQSGDMVTIVLNSIVTREISKQNGNVFLTIIDGQHRIRGIERAIEILEDEIRNINLVLRKEEANDELSKRLDKQSKLLKNLLDFELIVTFFIDPTLEYQAMIFATINKTQTKVPENLVYSLFGLTKDDSPQKTSLEVVLALNGIEKSPFFNRIKLVGATFKKGVNNPLSQATMVKSILNNICNNQREAETDRFLKRGDLKNNPKNLQFRPYYANNQDHKIVRILYSFFNAVRSTFKDEEGNSLWEFQDSGKLENILQTNVGYQALLKVLLYLLANKIKNEDARDKKEQYEKFLIKAKSLDFQDRGIEKRYPFTSISIKILSDDIISKF